MTCFVYTVRGEGCGHPGSLFQVWRLALMWSSGTMLPANYCMNPVCSEDQQLEAGIHSAKGKQRRFAGEKEFLRGLESSLRGRGGVCATLRGGAPLSAALLGALRRGQPRRAASASAVNCSKSCFPSLSCFCFCLQCHYFPLQCLDSQTTFSRENNVLLKMGSRSQCS